MTPEQQVKYCEKCEKHIEVSMGWRGRWFIGCCAGKYKGIWVAEIKECPLGKMVE